MAFEVSGSACEGWTVNFRMVNEFKPTEDKPRLIDTRSSSWESGDGMNMRYSQLEFVDNRLDDEKMLSASRSPDGGPGRGDATKPEARTFTFPAETIFPVHHQLKLMEAAERDDIRDASLVFDGSDGDKVFRTITFIGKRRPPGNAVNTYDGAEGKELRSLPSWPVSISYFEDQNTSGAGGEQTPVYQVSFEMFANGVAAGLFLNYGDFALRGRLASLEFLDQPACE
jgi:hypothetical protein